MSVRRQSCESCFRARRKCDLSYPSCVRCQQRKRTCHYRYPPRVAQPTSINIQGAVAARGHTQSSSVSERSHEVEYLSQRQSGDVQVQLAEAVQHGHSQGHKTPQSLGRLGELPPATGLSGFTWVFDVIRGCPQAFAKQAETIFIHKGLFGHAFPRPLRAAFGICAGCLFLTNENRSILFQALDAEISDLLEPAGTTTLLEDLVTLQAAVLYQIIRLFHGDLEEKVVAEGQEYLVRSFGLTLLRRADRELRDEHQTWEDWILAESIRRTVFIAFKIYTIYSTFKYGVCAEIAAIKMLPISTKTGSWRSRQAYQQYPGKDDTTTYGDFSSSWDASPRGNLELFEKFLIVGCKGTDKFEMLTGSWNGELTPGNVQATEDA